MYRSKCTRIYLFFSVIFVYTCVLTNSLDENSVVKCDVIIAGGSTAALGAAIASARKGKEFGQVVCLTEPTEWLGGQLTSSGVSAVDFGKYNKLWWFQSSTLQDMMESLGKTSNPGNCWVSTKCFLPCDLVNGWINQTVSALPNLKILYNTVIKSVSAENKMIKNVTVITRKPKNNFNQWSVLLSHTIHDWYSQRDSPNFSKQTIILVGRTDNRYPIVIDATEFGDVLVLSRASFRQGVETPTEASPTYETCGQAITIPFYIKYNKQPTTRLKRFLLNEETYSFNGRPWGQIWSYRRSKSTPGIGFHNAHDGEISNQNWSNGNDCTEGYIFLTVSEAVSQTNDWMGGINLDTLQKAETRAYGWFDYFVQNGPPEIKPFLSMGKADITGTSTGLSMVPYLRDTRRSIGIDGFVLKKSYMDTPDTPSHSQAYNSSYPHPLPNNQFSTRVHDSIAIGNYLYADTHGIANCNWPSYMKNNTILPYHIPFRALTNQDYKNFLVAGKTMAQSFFANAGTRLHPVEFVTGEAAGTAASIMSSQQLSSRQMFERVKILQDELEKTMPIFWDSPRHL